VKVTRRALARICGALLAAIATGGGAARTQRSTTAALAGSSRGAALRGPPVVSFFLDQPYLDTSGRATPYRPPLGLRSAQPLAGLSEEELRRIAPHA